jgi:cardiolipin synthase A/B
MRSKSPAGCAGNILSLAVAIVAVLAFSSCASAPRIGTTPGEPFEQAVDRYFRNQGIPNYASTKPILYFSSDAWKERALSLVENAHDYILISSFLVNYHEVNSKIMEALERKAREGVRVYVMFDSSSYFTYMPDMKSFLPTALARFKGTSVKVAEYNPISGAKIFAMASLLDRDHRKFWIVDGEFFAEGGMNLNYYSLAPSGEYSNIDTFVELRGKDILSPMVSSFCDTWNKYSPEPIQSSSFAIRDAETDSSVWLVNQTLDGKSSIDALFDAFFLNAEKEIWMLQAYTFATPALVHKIEYATRRGVAVNIILSANSFRASYDEAAKYCIEDILKAGAHVYMFDAPDNSFLHYKLMLADGRIAAFGSPNYNFRSQYLSRELAVVSADPGIARTALENVKDLMNYATPVTMEEARGYRGIKYFLSYLGMLFGG